MKNRKFISVTFCALMLASLFIGCTENNSNTEGNKMQKIETIRVAEDSIEEIPLAVVND